MNNVYGYIRVSDKKQEQGASLSEQKRILSAYAKAHDLNIIHFYKETKTAAKRGRPFFTEMMKNLKQGKAQGVIIHKIDRSARNLHDWADIGDLIDNNIQVYFAHENLNLNERGGRLSADIQAVMASDYVRNLRQETIKGQQGRLKQGIYPFAAPIGYINNGKGKVKTVDPIQGELIKQLFNFYITRNYNIRTLSKEMERRGLRNSKGNKVCKNGITKILKNPFYMGVLKVKGETYLGKHQPLISVSQFKKVQLIIKNRQNSKGIIHDYIFRRMLKCKECDYFLTGEKQKGRVYYRCHTKSCSTKTIREDFVQKYIYNALTTIQLFPAEIKDIEKVLHKDSKYHDKTLSDLLKTYQLQRKNLLSKQERLLDSYLDEVIEKSEYQLKKEKHIIKIAELEEKIEGIKREKNNTMSKLHKFFELCKEPKNIYDSGILEEKREYLKNVTSNLSVSGKKLYFSMASPYKELANRHVFQKCPLDQDKVRTMTSQIIYMDKNTSGIKLKPLNKSQIKQFLDYLSNDAQW